MRAALRGGFVLSIAFAIAACSSSSDDGKSSKGNGSGGGSNEGGMFGNLGSGGLAAGPLADGGLEDLRKAACAGETAATEAQPSVIQFVIDTSGSMGQRAPGGGGSKWEVTRDALASAMDSLPSTTAVGILYYPNQDTNPSDPNGDETDPDRPVTACVNTGALLPIDVLGPAGSAHRSAIASSLAGINPAGGTPTHDAYRVARDPIQNTQFPGSRYLVLITDGQPTFLSGCRGTGNISDAVDPRPIVDEVAAANAAGTDTFIIGSPGSEQVGVPIFDDARTWLSMAASQGGTAQPGCSDEGPAFCHFDMSQTSDFAGSLRQTLRLIVGAVLSCEYILPEPSNGGTLDPSKVNVILTTDGRSEILPKAQNGDCAGSDGWRYSSDGTRLEFCPPTCDRLKGAGEPELDILFGCSSVTEVQ